MTDKEVALDIGIELLAACTVLVRARNMTPERKPFREIDRAIADALAFAWVASERCKEMIS